MDLEDFEKNDGKAEPVKPSCDSRLPTHYRPRSHDGHLGGTELDWDEVYGGDPLRDHFGFRINHKTLY